MQLFRWLREKMFSFHGDQMCYWILHTNDTFKWVFLTHQTIFLTKKLRRKMETIFHAFVFICLYYKCNLFSYVFMTSSKSTNWIKMSIIQLSNVLYASDKPSVFFLSHYIGQFAVIILCYVSYLHIYRFQAVFGRCKTNEGNVKFEGRHQYDENRRHTPMAPREKTVRKFNKRD